MLCKANDMVLDKEISYVLGLAIRAQGTSTVPALPRVNCLL